MSQYAIVLKASVAKAFDCNRTFRRVIKTERAQKQEAWQKEKLSTVASGIKEFIQQRKKRSKKESLTEKALSIAKG